MVGLPTSLRRADAWLCAPARVGPTAAFVLRILGRVTVAAAAVGGVALAFTQSRAFLWPLALGLGFQLFKVTLTCRYFLLGFLALILLSALGAWAEAEQAVAHHFETAALTLGALAFAAITRAASALGSRIGKGAP